MAKMMKRMNNQKNYQRNGEMLETLPPKELIVGDTTKGVVTRSTFKHISIFSFIFKIVPKSINDAFKDEYWTQSMQAELNQFERNQL